MAYGPKSAGADMLLDWARAWLRWDDVAVEKNETAYELIVDSPATEFGRRMCVTGFVSVIDGQAGGEWGGLLSPSRVPGSVEVAFSAIGEAPRPPGWGRFCGVVAGMTVLPAMEYEGRTIPAAAAIRMIGLFDLRQNR